MEHGEISYADVGQQVYAIFLKNLRNSLSNKKKLLGELVLPLVISAIYAITQSFKKTNPLVAILLELLLKIYIGLVGTSALRELITIFITERTDHFRQYQMIFGVSFKTHTLSNLFYMGAYQSFFLLPFYVTLNYYGIDPRYVLYFGAFVVSSCTLTLALTSLFKDHKIALEMIGMLFSLGAFLPFAYDQNANTWLNFIIMAVPNSSFTIAILFKKTECALISLAFVKLYLLAYSILQFPEYYSNLFLACCRKIGQYVPAFDKQPNNLMEQFELNEVVNSELEHHSASSQRNVVIRTEGLIKTYKVKDSKINALNGVNLKICESQIVGLLGRNGAGKTSLVDILTGVTKPTQGSFQISANTSIGICYQHQVLYDVLTVQQHLEFYSRVKVYRLPEGSTRKSHIDDIINTLQIEGERNKKVKELSGGNKRKLSIAIAIIGRPQILIFDEPTSGLDPLSRIYVWDVFEELRRMRSTIILTTHHLDEAEKLTDWICVIEKGSIIVQNTAAQIKEKYGKGFHLEIFRDDGSSFQLASIDKYKSLVEKCQLKSVQLEHLPSQINLLVKPLQKEVSAFDFQSNFIELITELEKDEQVEVRFHSNTLEESFIAILRDEENSSGDSLGEQVTTVRQKHNLSEIGLVGLKQVVGVFIKSFLYQKSIFLQSVIIYNINILIILISGFFNSFFRQHLNTNTTTDQPPPAANNANPMMILQGYTIMATAFITAIVYEKEKKITGVLNARGLGWVAYWLGSFAFDYSVFWINLLILGNFVAAKEVSFLGWDSIGLLGVGVILYTYCASHLFEKVKSASAWFSIINMVLSLIILPMILFGNNTFFAYLDFIKYLYPYYDLTVKVFFEQNAAFEQLSELSGIAKPTGSTIHINIMIYILVIVWIELKPLARIRSHFSQNREAQMIDEKVRLEGVSKKFGSIQALKDVSYYVNEERLALLGHNGAGKSTTFGLLSAQLTADAGEVYLQNYLRPSWQSRLKSAGICYQQDALWQGMLVQQIITILSWVVPISNKEREVKWLFENLEFDSNNSFKRFSNLSGGNKRKLCMMVALYGDPSLRLLDECSTGLDPSSRLAMVQTIKCSKRGTTIFTTHSMSEAEELCTKTVIMSKGRTLQFDLISRLRSKHFSCCWVQIEVDEANSSKLTKQLSGQGVVISGQGKHLRLQVDKRKVRKSELMQHLLASKRKGEISNFSWVEPRLEDVYIKVTRENGDEEQVQPHTNVDVI